MLGKIMYLCSSQYNDDFKLIQLNFSDYKKLYSLVPRFKNAYISVEL